MLANDPAIYRDLKDDWDGQGSAAPHPALVDGAVALARHLEANDWPPADRVIVSVNGTVYFEWHTSAGYCEIEVTSPLDAECRWVPKGSDKAEVARLGFEEMARLRLLASNCAE